MDFFLKSFFGAQKPSRARTPHISPLFFTKEICYQFFEISKTVLIHQIVPNRQTLIIGQPVDDALHTSRRNLFYIFWDLRTSVHKLVLKRFNFWTFSYSDWTQNRRVFYTLLKSIKFCNCGELPSSRYRQSIISCGL